MSSLWPMPSRCTNPKARNNPAIVVPLVTQHYVMLQRNLLYTALTRARQMVVLVGSPKAVRVAVEADQPRRRQSLLSWRLGAVENSIGF